MDKVANLQPWVTQSQQAGPGGAGETDTVGHDGSDNAESISKQDSQAPRLLVRPCKYPLLKPQLKVFVTYSSKRFYNQTQQRSPSSLQGEGVQRTGHYKCHSVLKRMYRNFYQGEIIIPRKSIQQPITFATKSELDQRLANFFLKDPTVNILALQAILATLTTTQFCSCSQKKP